MMQNRYVDEYKSYLIREKDMRANTVACYITDVKQYMSFIDKEQADKDFISKNLLVKYINYLKVEGNNPSTISRKISAIKCFCKFMVNKGYSDIDPSVDLEVPKVDRPVPGILPPDKVKALLSQPDMTEPKGIRDKAMLETLYATGFKVSELLELRLEDVDLDKKYIRCVNDYKERLIPINKLVAKYLMYYINEARDKLLKDKTHSILFINCHGQPMSRQGFWKIVKYYAKKAGIDQEITPYTLRHSFAINMLSSGVNIKTVQQLLGHTDISTTHAYMKFLN